MFRNQYDNDVTIWSPQGRLFQVEYAMEAVKQGMVTVGIKSEEFAVLVALSRTEGDTNDIQRKIMGIDSHVGISIAGLTADAKQVCQYLRTECMAYRHSYSSTYPVTRLVTNLGNKMQPTTQRYDRRPYGVGMLIAGFDIEPYIYQVMPTANVINCKAMAIGARSQSSRTYLERNLPSYLSSTKDELICHGVQAIRSSLGNDCGENIKISIAIVGKNQSFITLSDEDCVKYLNMAQTLDKPDVSVNESDDNLDDDDHVNDEYNGNDDAEESNDEDFLRRREPLSEGTDSDPGRVL
ncbi:proteasome subunit alpha type-1 [Drosophila tropicalis]|uniref:proteasome subunit alpha type-1 n=1 Tax=Drosophila tropicalis TaxID=46794 RepID=UPI0035ABFD06